MGTIIAIDPGGTTGIAIRFSGEYKVIVTTTTKTPEELYDFIRSIPLLDTIVIENFAAQTIDRHGLYTVRLVGGIHAIAHWLDINYVLHQPSDRRSFLQDAKNLLRGRKVVIHEIDATAHLLRYEYDVSNNKVS